jgi:hypothetical protein
MRYIHELCLRRSRTEGVRPNSLWKCHECGYQFNFQRLTIQKFLGSKKASGFLTILVMLIIVFILGFIADPILNLYTDPYETIVGHEDIWQHVDVNQAEEKLSGWGAHFVKGIVSMGVLSFLRTMLLNPFHWFNLRNSGLVGGRVSGRATTGRDRAVNVSWIMVAMGVLSATYFFYRWVQSIIGRTLQRVGNNIVDTQLPGDDDDLKPPPGFKFQESYPDVARSPTSREAGDEPETEQSQQPSKLPETEDHCHSYHDIPNSFGNPETPGLTRRQPALTRPGSNEELSHTPGDMPGMWESAAYTSVLSDAQSQGWSFGGL